MEALTLPGHCWHLSANLYTLTLCCHLPWHDLMRTWPQEERLKREATIFIWYVVGQVMAKHFKQGHCEKCKITSLLVVRKMITNCMLFYLARQYDYASIGKRSALQDRVGNHSFCQGNSCWPYPTPLSGWIRKKPEFSIGEWPFLRKTQVSSFELEQSHNKPAFTEGYTVCNLVAARSDPGCANANDLGLGQSLYLFSLKQRSVLWIACGRWFSAAYFTMQQLISSLQLTSEVCYISSVSKLSVKNVVKPPKTCTAAGRTWPGGTWQARFSFVVLSSTVIANCCYKTSH